jgi:hypothetical protein
MPEGNSYSLLPQACAERSGAHRTNACPATSNYPAVCYKYSGFEPCYGKTVKTI